MVEIIFAPRFLKQAKKLPGAIKETLKEQIRRLSTDLRDPRLHVKTLEGKFSGQWSFRVTRDYRVLFSIEKESNAIYLLLTVDDRKNIYR